MTLLKRIFLLIGAAGAFSTALFLVINTGLPQRAAFTGQSIAGQLPVAPEINAVAPPFTLTNLDGTTIKLADLRGRPVIINFWATWCVPCMVEMPVLQTIYDEYHDRNLHILAINLGEPPDLIQGWQEALGLTYDMLIDETASVAAVYHLRGQPSTYIVSPNGIITHIFYGPISENTLRAALPE